MNNNSNKKSNYEAKYLNNVLDIGSSELKGFLVAKEVPEIIPSITLDSFNRIYFNADSRHVLGLKPHQNVSIAYNPSKEMFAVVVSDRLRSTSEGLVIVDKRYYANIKNLIECFGIKSTEGSPIYYDYVGEATVNGVHLFKKRG